MEGYIGVCSIAVLDNLSCGISVIIISKCGFAVFSEPAGCVFFFSILDDIENYLPIVPTFSEPFPVSDNTFPMKLSSQGKKKTLKKQQTYQMNREKREFELHVLHID